MIELCTCFFLFANFHLLFSHLHQSQPAFLSVCEKAGVLPPAINTLIHGLRNTFWELRRELLQNDIHCSLDFLCPPHVVFVLSNEFPDIL